ncbi:hypothetical protein EWB00_003242 [Schistosoma japonicum]|uniref:UPAR/Ly6 domain-containing protein n=1 Tax=Schistosoma japonicum TaxID=6182 RepID=A0A4Z2D990_SCHJA|nr:hypothetical protein EWB00_003242 [Schistosoma japonicum]
MIHFVERDSSYRTILSINKGYLTNRECAPQCSFDYFSKRFPEVSYYCCQRDYCNKSVNTRGMHQILLMIIITFICFFINKKK